MRRVYLLSLFQLERANFQNVPRPRVHQPHNLLVQIVDGFAVLGNVHEGSVAPAAGSSTPGATLPLLADLSASVNCSGGAVASPGSTVNSDSGLVTAIFRSSSAAGKSSRLRKPKYSRNNDVVPYVIGRPITSARPTCSINPRSSNVCITPSTATPRICSISDRVNGCRYAMIANVSNAGCESRPARFFCPTSALIHGAYS